jgi:hypothetical protein
MRSSGMPGRQSAVLPAGPLGRLDLRRRHEAFPRAVARLHEDALREQREGPS